MPTIFVRDVAIAVFLGIVVAVFVNLRLSIIAFPFMLMCLLALLVMPFHWSYREELRRRMFPDIADTLWRWAGVTTPIAAFIMTVGLGYAVHINRVYGLAREVDHRRAVIEAQLAEPEPWLEGYTFSEISPHGGLPVLPCYTDQVIIYYRGSDYLVVLPLDRPNPMSSTSFSVIMWDHVRGWSKDRIRHSLLM